MVLWCCGFEGEDGKWKEGRMSSLPVPVRRCQSVGLSVGVVLARRCFIGRGRGRGRFVGRSRPERLRGWEISRLDEGCGSRKGREGKGREGWRLMRLDGTGGLGVGERLDRTGLVDVEVGVGVGVEGMISRMSGW